MKIAEKLGLDSDVLLTIAIPTYNRERNLDFCLERIFEEIGSLSDEWRLLVSVYVSDNASMDGTSQVISKYQLLTPKLIRAVRNDVNIGADLNIAQCYDSAVSPYVWVLGDDDVIIPGRLQAVLSVLSSQNVDVLYVNCYWFKGNYKGKLRLRESKGIFKFESPLKFVRRTNVMLTFISCLVVRSGVGLELRKELISSNLVQLSWVLPLLRNGRCFAVIEDVVVAAKGGNSGGYELVKVFGENLTKITNKLLKDKSELAKIIQNGVIVNFFPGFVLNLRRGSSQFKDDGKDIAAGLKLVFGDNWRYYIFLFPLIVLPSYLARCYYFLIRFIWFLVGPRLI